MSVRRGRSEDADALGRVHVDAWLATYRGLIADDFLDALDPAASTARWRKTLADPATNCLVAVDEADAVRGFSLFGKANHDPDLGEVYAINLEPSAWGTGLGRELLRGASDELHAMGFAEAVLWVVDGNSRARRFYEIAGWAWDGATKDEDRFGEPPVRELRYRRALPAGGED